MSNTAMNFIDETKIYVKAGDGGDGCVSFRREKFIEFGGPDGGNGGRGGSVIFVANSAINTLCNFRYNKHFNAQRGENGKGKNRTGASGFDLILEVPVGTQIFLEPQPITDDLKDIKDIICNDAETKTIIEEDRSLIMLLDMTYDGQREIIAKGGDGGAGNHCFKSSKNRAPRTSIPGKLGDELLLRLQLKLLSDVGLVGLPNAGKSSFLSAVTAASPKIANYKFTTLKPQLGIARIANEELVIADLPGLIDGASQGKGLGHRFLRHIERCRLLLHIIDIESEDPAISYQIITKELDEYSDLLKKKREIIVLNKIDKLSEEEIEKRVKALSSILKNERSIFLCSVLNNFGLERILLEVLRLHREEISKKEEISHCYNL